MNEMQERKKYGCSWYLLLCDIFHDFGLRKCPDEPVLFSFYGGQEELIVCNSMDDFLGTTTKSHTLLLVLKHVFVALLVLQFRLYLLSNI